MKAAQFLAAMARMPLVTPEAFMDGAPFVVLSPHPDDESLGLGGMIAAARHAGRDVRIVILTDGAGSHPNSRLYPPDRLIALRKAEARAAAAILGVPPHHLVHLDMPDAAAPSYGPVFDAAVAAVRAALAEAGARHLFVTWGHDPHCDHEAADAVARAVRRQDPAVILWSYPIWGRHLEPGVEIEAGAPDGVRLDIAAWLPVKHRAIAAYASQMTALIADDPGGFRFTEETLRPFLGPQEYVFRVAA